MPRGTGSRQANKKSENGPAVKLPARWKETKSSAEVSKEETSVAVNSNGNAPVVALEGRVLLTRNAKRKELSKDTETDEVHKAVSNSTVVQTNFLKNLDLLQYAPKRYRSLYIKSVQNHFVKQSIKQLTAADYAGVFTRRITALAWNEKYPYVLACGSKFGDIMLISGSLNQNEMLFQTKAELPGGGAGCSVTAMKFHPEEMNVVYRSSIDCTVAKVDLVRGETTEFFNTDDYNRWFCGMDLNVTNKMVIAGDNKGTAYKFSPDGKLLSTWRLHKNKIHHIEFSKKDPNLLVTSSLDKSDAVRFWDVRLMKDTGKDSLLTPLQSLPHACGLNCAKFSPMDGSRLLTSDQNDEIRIYQGPLWIDYLTIKHHHKQFQHLTPIKADWHPVNDYIVIGRYPRKVESSKQQPARAIEFFDSYSGELVDMIYPPLNEICSLNVFNPTGEYLATGMNSKLILWKPGISTDVAENSKRSGDESSKKLSNAMRNALRGRRAREYSPASDEEEEDDSATNKKKRSKTTLNNPQSKTADSSTKSGTVNRKKKGK